MSEFPRRVVGAGVTRPGPASQRPLRFMQGEYGTFLAAMRQRMEVLFPGWHAAPGDLADALLDATAVVADQLSFVMDVYAAEGFLPTAQDPRAILDHVAVLPFRLGTGSGATGWVAFQVKPDKSGAIPAGTTIKGRGPLGPAVFETANDVAVATPLNHLGVVPETVGVIWNATAPALTEGRLSQGELLLTRDERLAAGHSLILIHRGANANDVFNGLAVLTVLEPVSEHALGFWQPVEAEIYALGEVPTAKGALYRPAAGLLGLFGSGLTAQLTSSSRITLRADAVNTTDKVLLLEGAQQIAVGDFLQLIDDAGVTRSLVEARTVSQQTKAVDLQMSTGGGDDVASAIPIRYAQEATRVGYLLRWEVAATGLATADPALWRVRHVPAARRVAWVESFQRGPLSTDLGKTMPLLALPAELERGRWLWVVGETGGAAVRVDEIDGLNLSLDLVAPLPDIGRVSDVLGNVVAVSQGESRREVIGSGNADLANQVLPLSKTPLTHLPDAASPGGTRAELEVRVEGVRFHPVEEITVAGDRDRVYALRKDPEGKAEVGFGDGLHGVRLPTGRANIEAHYRVGQGQSGNLPIGALSQVTGLGALVESAANPAATTGGEEPEPPEAARTEAPQVLRALDRVVSLSDVVILAERFPGIERAWAWRDSAVGQVVVVVLPIGGVALSTDLALGLTTFLRSRALPRLAFRVRGVTERLVDLQMVVCIDVDFTPLDVELAIIAALCTEGGLFDPAVRGIGVPLYRSDIVRAVQTCAGVRAIETLALRPAGSTASPVDWIALENDEIVAWTGDTVRDPTAKADLTLVPHV